MGGKPTKLREKREEEGGKTVLREDREECGKRGRRDERKEGR